MAEGELDINDIASDLAEVYYIEKDAKSEREELRGIFFEQVEASFASADLARKTVEIPEDVSYSGEVDHALKYHPGWRATDKQPGDGTVILEEDPKFKTHSEVVVVEGGVIEVKKGKEIEHPGYVIIKTVRSGSAMLDDERMKNLEPDLYEAVMVPRGYSWISDMVYEQNVDPDMVNSVIADFIPEDWPLEMRDDLSDEEIEALKPYSFEGPKQLALNVRYAKTDEI